MLYYILYCPVDKCFVPFGAVLDFSQPMPCGDSFQRI